jgi:hypothetical protein
MNLIAHALAVLIATAPAAWAAGQVYRWVDADGSVQYSERPPVGVRAEPIPLHYAPASRDQAADELKRLRERSGLGGATPAPAAPAQGQPSPEQRAEQDRQRAENCRTARENLRVLETTQRVMAKDAQGNDVRLDDSQKQARLEETRRQIEKFCGP